MPISAYLQGLGMGAGLIIAIGAQNAFVLTQGLKRQHGGLIALICIIADASLIALGVAGLGQWFADHPQSLTLLAWVGAAFLMWYGVQAARRASNSHALATSDNNAPMSRAQIMTTTLAVTLLNPHVYLDTVVLLGSISAQFQGIERPAFGFGAVTASILWFSSLSLGAHLLAPVLNQPKVWRVLDGIIAVMMFALAASLVVLAWRGSGH
jgi:L-lysine exporter family protein LysE/ArgO